MSSYQSWKLKCNEHGEIWIWCDHKFRIASWSIDEIHQYLKEFVKPADDIEYVGFGKGDCKIKGKRFLEKHNEP